MSEREPQHDTNLATARELTEDAKVFQKMETDADSDRAARREAFKEKRRSEERPRRRSRQRDGPEMER